MQGRSRGGDTVEFLRREVVDLERVIKSLHQTRTDDRYALEQAEGLLVRSRDESAMHEGQHELAQHALLEMRTHHTAALAAAAAREAEARMLTVELRLMCNELFEAEAEREMAREAEASALSIARSYRGFAAQGASRLEDVRGGIQAAQARVLQRLEGYQAHAQHNWKLRALRSVRGWRASRDMSRSLARWMLLVFTAEQRAAVAARLEAAYRQRDVESAAQRVQMAAERRVELETAKAAKAAHEEQLAAARKERDAAKQTAEAEREARRAAEIAAEDLRAQVCTHSPNSLSCRAGAHVRSTLRWLPVRCACPQLSEAQAQVAKARRSGAADLAAARDQLTASKREISAASAPLAVAHEAQRTAEASLLACRAALAARDEEVAAARLALEEESRTRLFLERVLKDERTHAARRAEVWRLDQA